MGKGGGDEGNQQRCVTNTIPIQSNGFNPGNHVGHLPYNYPTPWDEAVGGVYAPSPASQARAFSGD